MRRLDSAPPGLWRRPVLSKQIDNWSLTSLQLRLARTGKPCICLLVVGLAAAAGPATAQPAPRIVIDYPVDGSSFPPDMAAPTFLWRGGEARPELFGNQSGGLPPTPPGLLDERSAGFD